MLKVVVFDSGWGGELFAKYLESEVGVLEVIRELDWIQGNYCKYSKKLTRSMAEARLKQYIGKVDLIVLASYTISEAALVYLSEKYPEQRFLGFKPRLAKLLPVEIESDDFMRELKEYKAQLRLKRRIWFALRGYGKSDLWECLASFCLRGQRESVVILASNAVRRSQAYRDDVRRLEKRYRILEPYCEEWAKQIDAGTDLCNMTFIGLPVEPKISAVLIYGTTFMKMRDILMQVYGWRVKIYDDFYRSMKEVCLVLKMKGISMTK